MFVISNHYIFDCLTDMMKGVFLGHSHIVQKPCLPLKISMEWMFVSLACMYKNMAQSVHCQTHVVCISHIWIVFTSFSPDTYVHLSTMKFSLAT